MHPFDRGGISVLAVVCIVLATLYSVIAWLAVRMRPLVRAPRPSAQPPVSILKPLCGEEPALYECLRSFCVQDYPNFQIIFGVSDPLDAALPVARRLKRELPECDIRICINSQQRGRNLKVNNLINMLPLADHDFIVIADSDVRVAADCLRSIVPPLLDAANGIVTCPYVAVPRAGLWSLLGSLFINDWFIPSAYVAAWFGSRSFAFGATMALHRRVLTAVGGFASIADQLADDYRLGQLTRRLGLRTVLSEFVVETFVDEPSLNSLLKHELRWLRTIRSVRPWGYALALVSFDLPVAILCTIALSGAKLALALLCATTCARLLMHQQVHAERLTVARLLAVVLSDFLAVGLWMAAFFTRCVQWRQTRYRVARDGAVQPLT